MSKKINKFFWDGEAFDAGKGHKKRNHFTHVCLALQLAPFFAEHAFLPGGIRCSL